MRPSLQLKRQIRRTGELLRIQRRLLQRRAKRMPQRFATLAQVLIKVGPNAAG